MIDTQATFIGTGALGTALAKALYKKDIPIYSLYNRSPESLQALTEVVKPAISASFPKTFSQLGDVIFITTSDDSIPQVANELVNLSNKFSNKIILHCSGSLPSSVLSALQKKGASVAAFHPTQTFTTKTQPDFNGITFDVEGDAKAVNISRQLADILNARFMKITPEAKLYLHAAGVTSCNYLVALLSISAKIAEMGGIERSQAIKVLMPVVQKTLDNVGETEDLSEALGGPVARGDVITVAKHLELFKPGTELMQLYKLLGRQTLEIAQKGHSKEVIKELAELFEDE